VPANEVLRRHFDVKREHHESEDNYIIMKISKNDMMD
jgi:hypothetical protein